MNDVFSSLEPFPGPSVPAGLEVRCAVNRCGHVLRVSWELAGNRADVAVPPPVDVPARRHGLWKETCFELFLARPYFRNYWEFNISPSGDWNVYRFDAYREGMREEDAFHFLPIRAIRDEVLEGECLKSISLEIDLGRILPATAEPNVAENPSDLRCEPFDIAICAVIRGLDGKVSWWALVHRGPEPDFHRRDSFVIRR